VPEIFTYSSNIGAAKIALSMGVEHHKWFLKKMGLLDRLRTELPESTAPLWPKRWGELNTVTIAYGHGIAVAPLQAVAAINALVNGGHLIPPTFMKRSKDEAMELAVQTAPTGTVPAMAARLIVQRKSPEAAEESRRKIRQEAQKKGRTVHEHTLETAAYMFVLTSVPAESLDAAQVLELYRFRWQIEMAFKRLKQILPLHRVPVKDPDLAKTYLYANLLAALLTEDLARDFLAFSP